MKSACVFKYVISHTGGCLGRSAEFAPNQIMPCATGASIAPYGFADLTCIQASYQSRMTHQILLYLRWNHWCGGQMFAGALWLCDNSSSILFRLEIFGSKPH